MLKTYIELCLVLEILGIQEITEYMPSNSEHSQRISLIDYISNLESVSKELQEHNTAMADARTLFDAVIIQFPI